MNNLINVKTHYTTPEDLQVTHFDDLPNPVKEKISIEYGEFIVSRKYSRNSSKSVNVNVVDFLREFSKPTTLIEAIIHTAKINGENPEHFLEKIYPIVRMFIKEKFLVSSDSDSQDVKQLYPNGTQIKQFKIQKTIQVFEESDVYQVTDANNSSFVLKIIRDPTDTNTKKNYLRMNAKFFIFWMAR